MATLDLKISELNNIGKVLLTRLKRLKIETIKDLIFYYPFRYENYSQIIPIADLNCNQEAVVIGRIELLANKRSSRQRKIFTEAILTDDSGSIKIIWFNQPWIVKNIKIGERLRIWGKLAGDDYNFYFNSPNYEKYNKLVAEPLGLMPVYPLTYGLSNKQLSFLIKTAIDGLDVLPDYLPEDSKKKNGLLDLSEAIKEIHFPSNLSRLAQAKKRLAFDELFAIQAKSQIIRQSLAQAKAPSLPFAQTAIKNFVNSLPFALTDDQKKASWEIIKDIEKTLPMNRLLEGDVSSGKTIVALMAMYNTAVGGYQSVLMSPTEILASQHYRTISGLLASYSITVALLTRSQALLNGETIKKTELIKKIASGEVKIIIGTHALIQDAVQFNNLALTIIDEQHRFGVRQRQKLKESNLNGLMPHFLSLTATPIPRSLSLVFYGDLDLSIIKQLPAGRKTIITKAIDPASRLQAYDFIKQQIGLGRQVFVICPLIDPSDKLGVKSVTEEYKKLNQDIFPDLEVGLLHGKMSSAEKEAIMAEFKANKIKILVATSVVEVGVDIPNASVMMVEGADRFGLAQLHQFRGRVGRGEHQSYCFLFSDSASPAVAQRLQFLAGCSDGFRLAEYDLKNRGAGDVFSSSQSGFFEGFRLADPTDLVLVKLAQATAERLIAKSTIAEREAVLKRFIRNDFVSHLE